MVLTRATVHRFESMDRGALEKLSSAQLKEEARRLGLSPTDSRGDLVDAIMSLLERNERNAALDRDRARSSQQSVPSEETDSANKAVIPGTPRDESISALQQVCATLATQLQSQQLILNQLLASIGTAGAGPPNAETNDSAATLRSASTDSPRSVNESPRSSSLATTTSAQAVTLLASQIPEFSGSERHNVEMWTNRVEKVAAIHAASEGVVFLAATSKLTDTAKRWFDLGDGPMLESWRGFKEAVVARFKRKILFHVAMQQIEARKWIHQKESFFEYASEKLALIQPLQLPTSETIHLLINGIGSTALRATAAAIEQSDIDKFLSEMQQVASASFPVEKKSGNIKQNNKEDKGAIKKGHSGRMGADRNKELTCFHCKVKGHRKAECPDLRQNQHRHAVSAVQKEADADTSSTVACVAAEISRQLICNGSPINIIKLGSNPCYLQALIDTGSPISFIREDAYKKCFDRSLKPLPSSQLYKALNSTPINILGTIETLITFEQLPGLSANIKLHVIDMSSLSVDIVVGRDLLDHEGFSV